MLSEDVSPLLATSHILTIWEAEGQTRTSESSHNWLSFMLSGDHLLGWSRASEQRLWAQISALPLPSGWH